MKLLNTAPDMDNFSVAIHTTGLSCHHKAFHIYGHQDVGNNQGETLDSTKLHFVGIFSKFETVDTEIVSGLNRRVFKPVVSGLSPYVFVVVKGIPESETWKICEVEFT